MRWQSPKQELPIGSIAKLGPLAGMSDKDIQTLVSRGTHLTAYSGQQLAAEGSAPNGAFLIVDGEVAVTQGDHELRRLGPGAFVGEIALLDWSRAQTATVTATSDVEVLRFSNDDMEALSRILPRFKRAMDDSAFSRLEGDADGAG